MTCSAGICEPEIIEIDAGVMSGIVRQCVAIDLMRPRA